jgi:hypothetical protein
MFPWWTEPFFLKASKQVQLSGFCVPGALRLFF